MFLSAKEIEACVQANRLRIDPFAPELLKPASYVLRLGQRFARWKPTTTPLRPWAEVVDDSALAYVETAREIELTPGELILANTYERLALSPSVAGILSTLSHLARLGVTVTSGSTWVNPGFGETEPTALTLEISNVNRVPIVLDSGMPVCHLAFAEVSGEVRPRGPLAKSIYDGSKSPSGPRLFEEYQFLRKLK
jgi:dCTP deaminase